MTLLHIINCNASNFKFERRQNYVIAEARSFDKGIEFYCKEIVIDATRQDNKVIISKSKLSKLGGKENRTISYGALLFSIIGTLVSKFSPFFENSKIQVMGIVVLSWLGVICYYLFNSRTSKQSNRYHAAEHKVLNYIDKYGKEPENCDEVMKMSSVSYRCGSTILVVIMLLLTLCISVFFVYSNISL